MIRILLFAPVFPPAVNGGGPSRSMDTLTANIPPGYSLHVIANSWDMRQPMDVERHAWSRYRCSTVMYMDPYSVGTPARMIRATCRVRPDLYYLDSFFSPIFTILPVLLICLGVLPARPVLIAPRGEFSTGALALKARKKRLYLSAFRRIVARRRVLWHATSDLERNDILRVMGHQAEVLLREQVTEHLRLPVPGFVAATEQPALRMIFLSRVVRKKNLAMLLVALKNVTSPVQLDIYGPLEDPPYWTECQLLIADLPTNVLVRKCGVVAPDRAVATFNQYDLFVFPTRGENFGHVIAESLAASCPVMIADTTPWTELIREGGGVLVDSGDPTVWTAAIEDYARLAPEHVRARREAAGVAYLTWQNRPKGEHLFELISRTGAILAR